MGAQRFYSVLRARRNEPTRGRQERRKKPLISPHDYNKDVGHLFLLSSRGERTVLNGRLTLARDRGGNWLGGESFSLFMAAPTQDSSSAGCFHAGSKSDSSF